jgi:hypothetical protein
MVAGLPKVSERGTPRIVFSRRPRIHSTPAYCEKVPPELRCLRRSCWQSIALSGWRKRTDGIEAAQPPARVQYGGGQRPPPTCVTRPTASLGRKVGGRVKMTSDGQLDTANIYIPRTKAERRPVERLGRLVGKRDRSVDDLVLEEIVEYLGREKRKD